MSQILPLEIILFLGFTICAGLIYLLLISYRSRKYDSSRDDEPDDDAKKPGEEDDDPAWRAKRFWWFGR